VTNRVTDVPFSEELPRLLAERGMSTRALAIRVGVSPSHLSRVVRRKDYKTPGPKLMRKIAAALDLPDDYFPESRELVVLERIRTDPKLRDELYKRLKHPA
jgi:transcriptional regulator with XRE-family HTH domain